MSHIKNIKQLGPDHWSYETTREIQTAEGVKEQTITHFTNVAPAELEEA